MIGFIAVIIVLIIILAVLASCVKIVPHAQLITRFGAEMYFKRGNTSLWRNQ